MRECDKLDEAQLAGWVKQASQLVARVEGKCALQALFTRWPKLEMAVTDAQIRWHERPGLRAIETLPVVARRV